MAARKLRASASKRVAMGRTATIDGRAIGFEDEFAFLPGDYPRHGRKTTVVGPGILLRFKTGEDQAACKIALVTHEEDGSADLHIDASSCVYECRLLFSMPNVGTLICAGRPGAVFELAFELSARMSGGGGQPIRQVSLFENDPDDVLRTVHKLSRAAPLAATYMTHAVVRHHERPARPAGSYDFGIIIGPRASAFSVRRASARAVALATMDCQLAQSGNRLQGVVPAGAKRALIKIVRGRRSADIPLADGRFSHVQAGVCVEFDADLAGLGLHLGSDDGAVGSDGYAMLRLDDGLAAITRVVFPPVDDAEQAVIDAGAHLGEDHRLLGRAEFEIRRLRNSAGLSLLDRVSRMTADHDQAVARLRMRAFASQRRFAEAVTLFESLDGRLRDEPAMRSRYIEACANLGDTGRARAELERMAFFDRRTAVANIASLYRFVPLLSPAYRGVITDMMASVSQDLRPHARVIMRCAHDYLRAGDWKGYFDLIGVLDRFDLSQDERGRLALLRAQLAFEMGNSTAMLEQLNVALALLKASPVDLRDRNGPVTPDNIVGRTQSVDTTGPLVSVMMTSFNSEATIGYAIQSILDQGYGNLELLVVDDASGDGSPALINEFAARDTRVVPILSTVNAGTYVSKNLALAQARGDFVTCQDSDDWAHPQKIETGVARLRANPRLVATGVQYVRLSPDTGLQFRTDYVRPDASSLLYRIRPVLNAIGYYDSVRAGADTEFQRRLELSFGSTAVRYGQELLSLVLWSSGSLSGGGEFAIDEDSGVLPPSRNAYWRSFVEWHERTTDHYLGFPLTQRPFEAPASMLPVRS